MKHAQWLLQFAADTYSQTGEDGIIAKILSLLPATDKWCCEFGAWDGIHLSNVRKLIREQNYRAVMIEGNSAKHKELVTNYAGNPDVHAVNAFVGFDESTGLDAILGKTPIPNDFDLLSIDIDGNDYHVWNAVRRYRPKIVCIEFNPTIPTEVSFIQQLNPRLNHGSSVSALWELGKSKGYEAVCVMRWNIIFVEQKLFPLFEISDNRPQTLRSDLSNVTWLFSGQDGSIHLAGAKRLPWHGIELNEKDFQVLPAVLQAYPDDYNSGQREQFENLKRAKKLRPGVS